MSLEEFKNCDNCPSSSMCTNQDCKFLKSLGFFTEIENRQPNDTNQIYTTDSETETETETDIETETNSETETETEDEEYETEYTSDSSMGSV